jgi:hypothetical protein
VFSTPDKAALLKLIDVLRTVTAGMLVFGSKIQIRSDPKLETGSGSGEKTIRIRAALDPK